MTPPTIVVAGFARCGSSLTMQMLRAGGVPCVGEPPAFEDMRVVASPIDAAWFASLAGHAVKILEPQRNRLPADAENVVCIWLDRDSEEQGKSQEKFLRLAVGLSIDRGYAKACAESIRRDRAAAIASLAPWPVLFLSFEDLLMRPRHNAVQMAQHAKLENFDSFAAASIVKVRALQCAPGLAIEMELMQEEAAR